VTPQEWIIVVFLFMFGCCIGSFLNVVIYRLPREKSLVHPGSACPRCDKAIRFYDNIPLLSWLALRAKCRYCKAPISPRYFIVELLTGSVFLGVYLVYFHTGIRPTMGAEGSWFVYALHLVLIAAFIAASGIDLELWIIPLSICWFVTAAGLIGSAAGGYLLDPLAIKEYSLLPTASPGTGAMAVGAAIGLGIGWLLLRTGALKRSYEQTEAEGKDATPSDDHAVTAGLRGRDLSTSRSTTTGSKPCVRFCSSCRSSSGRYWRKGSWDRRGRSGRGGAICWPIPRSADCSGAFSATSWVALPCGPLASWGRWRSARRQWVWETCI